MLQHLKDYGIWLLAVFARGVMVFMFNTGKKWYKNYLFTFVDTLHYSEKEEYCGKWSPEIKEAGTASGQRKRIFVPND